MRLASSSQACAVGDMAGDKHGQSSTGILFIARKLTVKRAERRAWPSGYGARLACRKSRVRLPPGVTCPNNFSDPIDQDIRTQ